MKKLRTAFVACSVTMAATLCPIAFAQDVKKPNIVLINMDNFGWGEPGFNGGGIIRGTATPNMDQLAAEGLRLTNFNVEAQCTPSRASLMSGRYGVRSGNHTIPLGGGVYGLTQWEVTIAEMLEEVGYYSAAYGKWHLGWSEGRYPTNQGFDEFYGIESVEQSIWPSQPALASSGVEPGVVMQGIKGEPASVVREWNLEYRALIDGDLTEKANDFIRRRAETGEPFFLYLPYTATHFPTLVDPEFEGATGNGVWADLLYQIDTYVGRITDTIDELGIADNTIVIFTADNGPEALTAGDSHVGMENMIQGTPGPWRGAAFTPFEGSLRVPFVARWPGRIPAGSASNEVVHMMDLFPTFAAFAGGTVPADRYIDGVDQSAFFLGEQQQSNRDGVIVYMGAEIYGAKYKNWKVTTKEVESPFAEAIEYPTPRLYNLLTDPGERQNVIFIYTWAVELALQQLGEHQKTLEEYPPVPPGAPDPYEPPK